MNRITKVKKLIVHHSAADASISTLKNILKWHEEKGLAWNGYTGYHYYIGTDGHIIPDRPEEYWGAHCYGHNHNSLGIILAGNFEWQYPTPYQIKSLVSLLSQKVKQYNLKYWNIYGHRSMKFLFVIPTTSTACPGQNLYKVLPDIRRQVQFLVEQENMIPLIERIMLILKGVKLWIGANQY